MRVLYKQKTKYVRMYTVHFETKLLITPMEGTEH